MNKWIIVAAAALIVVLIVVGIIVFRGSGSVVPTATVPTPTVTVPTGNAISVQDFIDNANAGKYQPGDVVEITGLIYSGGVSQIKESDLSGGAPVVWWYLECNDGLAVRINSTDSNAFSALYNWKGVVNPHSFKVKFIGQEKVGWAKEPENTIVAQFISLIG